MVLPALVMSTIAVR